MVQILPRILALAIIQSLETAFGLVLFSARYLALLPDIGIGPKRRLIFRDFDLINDLVHLSGLGCMTFHLWVGEATMNVPMVIYSQLLATKFFVPVPSGTLISRPRLTALLD